MSDDQWWRVGCVVTFTLAASRVTFTVPRAGRTHSPSLLSHCVEKERDKKKLCCHVYIVVVVVVYFKFLSHGSLLFTSSGHCHGHSLSPPL